MKKSFMEEEANNQKMMLNPISHRDEEEKGNTHTCRVRYDFSLTQLEKPNSRTLASMGENMEQKGVSCITARNANLYIHFREQFGKLSNLKMNIFFNLKIPTVTR